MAKEGDVSYLADIVAWGMPFAAIPLGIPVFAIADAISRLRKLGRSAPMDYRDRVCARIEYFRTHPADPAILDAPAATPPRQSGH